MADLHHDSALSVRLPRALRDELDELARRLSSEVAVVTTAEVVRLLIREGLAARMGVELGEITVERRGGLLFLCTPSIVIPLSVEEGMRLGSELQRTRRPEEREPTHWALRPDVPTLGPWRGWKPNWTERDTWACRDALEGCQRMTATEKEWHLWQGPTKFDGLVASGGAIGLEEAKAAADEAARALGWALR